MASFYICSCRKSVLLVLRWFSETVVLCVVADLVSMRGGELRIFLFHHLELEARSLAFECQFSLSIKSHFLWFGHFPHKKHTSGWDHLSHCLMFSYYSATICLLIGPFNPFTFKIVIEWYLFIAILFFILVSLSPLIFFFFLRWSL